MADVNDTFNRADDPTSLGTATSGQVWTQVAAEGAGGLFGDPYGILSNQGFNAGTGGALGDSLVVVDSGMSMTRGQVTINNATAGSSENLRNQGVIILYVDDTHYLFLTYARAFGGLFRLYAADGGTANHIGPDCAVTMNDGDTMGWAICGQVITAYHNGVVAQNYPFIPGSPLSSTLLLGTQQGLQSDPGTSAPGTLPLFDDFTVVANADCTTFDCTGGECVLNADGQGEFASLAACQASCGVTPSYNCVDGVCCDPGDGSGTYATLAACEAAGCAPIPPTGGIATVRFDEGIGNIYYLVAPVVDSGSELRSKTIKSVRVTGKKTNVSAKVYGYDVGDEVNVTDLEDGTNSDTGAIAIANSTLVSQSPRQQVNVPNAVLHTVRIEGNDTGETVRDRIDEITTEQSIIGVRR